MADAEDYAGKGLDILGGAVGTVATFLGGGSEGAKAPLVVTNAIKDLVGMATGSAERKLEEADARKQAAQEEQRKLEERRLALEERKLALLEEQQRKPDKIRGFDAPMYPARTRAVRPTPQVAPRSTPTGDRIVDLVDLPGQAEEPKMAEASEPGALRTGDTREAVLASRGPLVDGAAPPGDSREGVAAERPPLVAYAADPKHFERAGEPHQLDAANTLDRREG